MEKSILSRAKTAWNVFFNKTPITSSYDDGPGYYYSPSRIRLAKGNERSIVNAIFTRIAIDAATVSIKHVRLDDEDRYVETINSGLNNCLSIEANIDQSGRAFIQDAVMSMLDEGVVALVPVDTSADPNFTRSYDIYSMRTAKIIEWKPQHIKVRVYNERTGLKEDALIHKRSCAIAENPLYSIINESNSTIQRLIRKLNLLDAVDEQSSSGKLDLIIQLPYVVKNELRKKQAEERRAELERQLSGSKYGIAYTDGTEKITQLNRPVENNLMKQIEYLTNMAYSQIGVTQSILDGTADEKTMLNYYTRLIEPIVSVLVDAMIRSFITRTARSQKQTLMLFRDSFKLVPISVWAEIADKFTRNEILSANEIRQKLGIRPSNDPNADKLSNKNIKPTSAQAPESEIQDNKETEGNEIQNE